MSYPGDFSYNLWNPGLQYNLATSQRQSFVIGDDDSARNPRETECAAKETSSESVSFLRSSTPSATWQKEPSAEWSLRSHLSGHVQQNDSGDPPKVATLTTDESEVPASYRQRQQSNRAYTFEQQLLLEQEFAMNPYLSIPRCRELSNRLNVSAPRVRRWFREKCKTLDQLKSKKAEQSQPAYKNTLVLTTPDVGAASQIPAFTNEAYSSNEWQVTEPTNSNTLGMFQQQFGVERAPITYPAYSLAYASHPMWSSFPWYRQIPYPFTYPLLRYPPYGLPQSGLYNFPDWPPSSECSSPSSKKK